MQIRACYLRRMAVRIRGVTTEKGLRKGPGKHPITVCILYSGSTDLPAAGSPGAALLLPIVHIGLSKKMPSGKFCFPFCSNTMEWAPPDQLGSEAPPGGGPPSPPTPHSCPGQGPQPGIFRVPSSQPQGASVCPVMFSWGNGLSPKEILA